MRLDHHALRWIKHIEVIYLDLAVCDDNLNAEAFPAYDAGVMSWDKTTGSLEARHSTTVCAKGVRLTGIVR